MQGTVTIYELDQLGICSMLEGNLMLRLLNILASLISITFIGHSHLSRKWLKSLFCIRCHRVLEALQWLKKNNMKYYGNINIDQARLMNLPEDDIPVEVVGVV